MILSNRQRTDKEQTKNRQPNNTTKQIAHPTHDSPQSRRGADETTQTMEK